MRLVSLMGGTTKKDCKHKIGQFGTGLKYIIAYMLRNELDFHICIGEDTVKLDIVKETIRDTEFGIIVINDSKSSITTNMGLDWKPWMIVRELYSNALDEGGESYSIVEEHDVIGTKDTTTFYIPMTIDFIDVYNNWDKYFKINQIPLWENDKYAVYAGNKDSRIYRQGILIKETKDIESVFHYDLKEGQINELREYTGYEDSDISCVVYAFNSEDVIEYFLEKLSNITDEEKEPLEAKIDISYWREYSKLDEAWKNVIGNAKIIHKEAKQKLLGANPKADLSGTVTLPRKIYQALVKNFEGISTLRVINKVEEFYEMYDEELELKVKQSLAILESCSYFIHPELTYRFGEFGDKKTLAKIDLDAKEILISQKMKDKSLFNFTAMLVEENEHFQTGFNDHTREFQQHFIDLYVKQMLDKQSIKL